MTSEKLKQLAKELEKNKPSLIICGGGHVGYYVAEIGKLMDFEVTLIDDREEFANKERFPYAKVICAPFVEAMKQLKNTEKSYFVIVARGHAHDAKCLEAVLHKGFSYVGMMGSRAKVKVVMDQMRELGFSEELLEKVHTPIGLKIGAITPAEIGVCIAAEMIQVKSRKDEIPYVGSDVIEAILKEEAAVVATIIEKQGSTPRGIGSMLILKKDGSIVGTVGGGNAESAVIQRAKILVGSGKEEVLSCNMKSKGEGNLGMVCGGDVKVLLQSIVD